MQKEKPYLQLKGPRGRPKEDQFQRRLEIYLAAAPLVFQWGARVTMPQVAGAAHMSVRAVYQYFPTKRELLLFPLQPGLCNWFVERFDAEYGHLRESDPQRYFDLWVEREIPGILMIRAAVQAAFELNPATAWQTIQDGFKVDMRPVVQGIQRLDGAAARHDPAVLERAMNRLFLSAVLDRTTTVDEVRAELYALVQGRPLVAPPVPISAVSGADAARDGRGTPRLAGPGANSVGCPRRPG